MSARAEQPDFKQVQYRFTAHVRNPQKHARPADIEARRMNIYNELLYNNVEGFMASSFPVLRAISDDDTWHALIRDYFEQHKATTPLFQEMPREFLKYLEHERTPHDSDYPFMLELAHYEWVELALGIAEQEIDTHGIDTDGDLLEGVPVLSPLAWVLTYQYPVHKICQAYLPGEPPAQPTALVVYRGRDDEVHFLELNPVTAHLLQLIQSGARQTSRQMLSDIAAQLQHPNPDVVMQGGLQILHDLKTRDVILGIAEAQSD